jgi:gamma-glutamylcyclotransferase (GGCT)/AIG2-like uncharacterized protein YtfP
MLYFAYGSNLNWEQMRGRCPAASFVSKARLDNHRLAFTRDSKKRGCGVADVVDTPGSAVWGVLYEVTGPDIDALDRCEGFTAGGAGNGYERVQKSVVQVADARERLIDAYVYIANKQTNPPPPSIEYKQLIVEGARHWKLPDFYLRELEAIRTR